MRNSSTGTLHYKNLPVLILFFICFSAWSQPATLTGIVTNGANGNPIIGSKITVNGQSTFSVSGGNYSLNISSAGNFPVNCFKTGYDSYTSAPIVFQPGVVTTLNIQVLETAYPPTSVTAVLDTLTGPKVNIAWQLPVGNYEVLYDDGLQDDFVVWGNQGNMNAVKFTPISYPAKITGGSINIGTPANYPPGSNPFVPFQVSVYNSAGTNGNPGNIIAGPVDVLPNAYGWIEFSFVSPPTISSGNFYIVMIQGGNYPNAAGLAVDLTSPKYRSFMKYVNGGGPWLPANGNYMIRAIVNGQGGPLVLTDDPASVVDHQVWRLRQGEEMNPAVWTSVGVQAGTSLTDFSWPSLPCGPYRWAVKTHYTGNRWSPPTFSNLIGKCWTSGVTVHVDLSCADATLAGTRVRLKNLVYPDTLYSATLDTTGIHLFPKVWRGTYELQVKKFNYQTYTSSYSITHDTTLNVILLQDKTAPTNLVIDNKSLKATWNQPVVSKELFSETWSGGNFSTNGWTVEGGYNWVVSQTTGNMAPSAMFGWLPQVTNYNQSLISKSLTGEDSKILTLKYDIRLDNFGTTTLNQMAVEIWDGTTWKLLKKYDNSAGSIPWTNETVDISVFTNLTFKLRFRAFGQDTYDINAWYIDNISIMEEESASSLAACIIGYNFYLNNALTGVVGDTQFYIPGELVHYGITYEGCVVALYSSGYSPSLCKSFTSQFLWPPRNLTGSPKENNAFLAWEKPAMPTDTGYITPPGLLGYNIYRNDSLIFFDSFPDSLSFYDLGLNPGTYTYLISAKYDLSSYGSPGQQANSTAEGPVTVEISYGRPLPFSEPWDQGTYSYNDWNFTPGQGNWSIVTTEGKPSPCSRFSGFPVKTGYDFSLESPSLDASQLDCAKIWFDFDIRLQDINANTMEELSAGSYFNGNWHKKSTWKNSGSFDWTPAHIDISTVGGNGFRIGFRVSGLNSTNLLHWDIDNVNVYAVCLPATGFTGESSGNDVQLQWSPPDCSEEGFILNEGFENTLFPPPHWTQIINNTGATWSHTDFTSTIGVHTGNYSAGINPDYSPQDEWLVVHDVLVTGNLEFWSMAFQGSSHGDHYYVKVSTDNEVTWETLFDLSSLPALPGGYNQWQQPYTVDMSTFMGEMVDIAWHAQDANGQGLWYYWGIDDCTMGSKKMSLVAAPLLYDVYRQDPSGDEFIKANDQPIGDTTYLDPMLSPGLYHYYVKVVNENCSESVTSDTISVDVVTSAQNQSDKNILVYPNPANDWLRVKSDVPVSKMILYNIVGMEVGEFKLSGKFETTIQLDAYPAGQYLLTVFISGKQVKFLITIVR